MPLEVNVDTTYTDDPDDASVKQHQQDHDALHAKYNEFENYTPTSFDAAGSAAAAQQAAQSYADGLTGDVEAHNDATTDVHGIADTADLETATGAQSKADAAEAAATAYTDAEIASLTTTLEAYADAGDATTLAAAQSYADGVAAGLAPKDSCRLATAAALPACTYANGSSGVGATLTGDSNGALTVDGTAVTGGDRIMVKNQASAAHNGIYEVTTAGSGGAAFVLTRVTDMDTSAEILSAFAFINVGTANAASGWVVQGAGPWTVGTTAVNWTQFSQAGNITAASGGGLQLVGSEMSIEPTAAATVLSLALKAPLASPTFTGTVTVPTPSNSTDATTKAYVDTAVVTGASVQAITLANGTNNNVALSAATTTLRISGPTAAFTITGFQNPSAGKRVVLINTTAYTMKLMHQNTGTTTAANRLHLTQQSSTAGSSSNWDILIGPNHPSVMVEYDATTARWRVVGRVTHLLESPGICMSAVGGANDNERLVNANAVRLAEGGKIPVFQDQRRTYSYTAAFDAGAGTPANADHFVLDGLGEGDHNVRAQATQLNISGGGDWLTGMGGARHFGLRNVVLVGTGSKAWLFERTTTNLEFGFLHNVAMEGLLGVQNQSAGASSLQGLSVTGFVQWINFANTISNWSGADHMYLPTGQYMSVQTGLASWHNQGALDNQDYILQFQGNHSKISGLYLTAECLSGIHVGAGGGRPYEFELSHSRVMGRNGDEVDEQCRGALIWIDGGKSRYTDVSLEFAMSSPSTGSKVTSGADAQGYVHQTSGESSWEGIPILRANSVSQDVPVWYITGSGTRARIRDAMPQTGPDGGAWTKRPIVKVDRTSGAFADVDRSVRLVEV